MRMKMFMTLPQMRRAYQANGYSKDFARAVWHAIQVKYTVADLASKLGLPLAEIESMQRIGSHYLLRYDDNGKLSAHCMHKLSFGQMRALDEFGMIDYADAIDKMNPEIIYVSVSAIRMWLANLCTMERQAIEAIHNVLKISYKCLQRCAAFAEAEKYVSISMISQCTNLSIATVERDIYIHQNLVFGYLYETHVKAYDEKVLRFMSDAHDKELIRPWMSADKIVKILRENYSWYGEGGSEN